MKPFRTTDQPRCQARRAPGASTTCIPDAPRAAICPARGYAYALLGSSDSGRFARATMGHARSPKGRSPLSTRLPLSPVPFTGQGAAITPKRTTAAAPAGDGSRPSLALRDAHPGPAKSNREPGRTVRRRTVEVVLHRTSGYSPVRVARHSAAVCTRRRTDFANGLEPVLSEPWNSPSWTGRGRSLARTRPLRVQCTRREPVTRTAGPLRRTAPCGIPRRARAVETAHRSRGHRHRAHRRDDDPARRALSHQPPSPRHDVAVPCRTRLIRDHELERVA